MSILFYFFVVIHSSVCKLYVVKFVVSLSSLYSLIGLLDSILYSFVMLRLEVWRERKVDYRGGAARGGEWLTLPLI